MKTLLKNIAKKVKGSVPLRQQFRDFDDKFWEIYDRCAPFTMTSPERMYALYQSTTYISAAGICGDIVECGVWRGGSSMMVAETLVGLGDTTRTLFLYDTYEGMTEPTEADKDHAGNSAQVLLDTSEKKAETVWNMVGLEEVKKNLAATGYPLSKIQFIKGKVEETIPGHIPDTISLLRLDTDWYESTRHELIHLYPLLEKNGVLIIDDYGYWQGARKAVDEYFADQNIPILLNRIDTTGRIATKI